MTETTTIRVDFVSESAAFLNTFGWYNKTTGEGDILFAGVEAQGPHPTVIAGVSYVEFTVATDQLNNIQFFLIANGDGISKNTDAELSGPIKVIQLANGTWAVATVDEDGNVETDHHGKPNILVGEGANAFFTETSKNAGGVDYASSKVGTNQTAATLAGDTADGLTGLIAWEDLAATRKQNGTYTQTWRCRLQRRRIQGQHRQPAACGGGGLQCGRSGGGSRDSARTARPSPVIRRPRATCWQTTAMPTATH